MQLSSSAITRAAMMMVIATTATAGSAAVIVNAYQDGPHVVFSGGGTLSLGGLTAGYAIGQQQPLVVPQNPQNSSGAFFVVGGTNASWFVSRQYWGDAGSGIVGPFTIGTGTSFWQPATVSGNYFGINCGIQGYQKLLVVDDQFVSGSLVAGTSTFLNTTLEAMGLSTGTYTWTWGAGGLGVGDSYTLKVGAVPEPSAWVMGAIGITFAGLRSFRRRQKA